MEEAGAVVDLVAVRAACASVVTWYERFLAEGQVGPEELDDALAGLRLLPRLGGQLGVAITTLLSGGAAGTTHEIEQAFRQLEKATGARPDEGARPTTIPWATGGTRLRIWTGRDQLLLPGFE